jgi:predicted nucleic acid-binding protein
VVNDGAEFGLWLSPHILSNTGRVLAEFLKTPDEEADAYLQVLTEIAEASGGGVNDPPRTVGDCPDWEDNRILDLAAAVGAFPIVSADADLTSMSPWRGRPIVEPAQFASLIDASRRARADAAADHSCGASADVIITAHHLAARDLRTSPPDPVQVPSVPS